MSKKKPLVVIISGTPGSGKTTLAQSLAHYMRIPHVERDTVVYGIELTEGGKVDKATHGIPAYYDLLTNMIGAGISLVTDGTLYKGISENDIKTKLIPIAYVVNIHTRAKNGHERFYDREMNREDVSKDWVEGFMEHLEKIYPQTVNPLELGVTTIEVDTNGEYIPSIPEIVAAVRKSYDQADKKE